MGWVVNTTHRPLYPQEWSYPFVYENGRAPGPVWEGAENLTSTRIRYPDRPVSIPTELFRPNPLSEDRFKMSLFTTTGTIWVTVQWDISWTRHWAFGFRKRRGVFQLSDLTSVSQGRKYSMTLICYCADTDKIITSSGQTTCVSSKTENSQQSFITSVNSRELVLKYKREVIPHRGQTLGALCQGQQNTAWLLWAESDQQFRSSFKAKCKLLQHWQTELICVM